MASEAEIKKWFGARLEGGPARMAFMNAWTDTAKQLIATGMRPNSPEFYEKVNLLVPQEIAHNMRVEESELLIKTRKKLTEKQKPKRRKFQIFKRK